MLQVYPHLPDSILCQTLKRILEVLMSKEKWNKIQTNEAFKTLMNVRNRAWGLVNGQLAEFDTSGKLIRFVSFKVGR